MGNPASARKRVWACTRAEQALIVLGCTVEA